MLVFFKDFHHLKWIASYGNHIIFHRIDMLAVDW